MEQEPSSLQIAANCSGCGRCVAVCRQHALTLETEHVNGFGRKSATVDRQRCVGCGVCITACPHHALQLPLLSLHPQPRPEE